MLVFENGLTMFKNSTITSQEAVLIADDIKEELNFRWYVSPVDYLKSIQYDDVDDIVRVSYII